MRDSAQLLQVVYTGMVNAGLDVDAIFGRLGYDAAKLGQRDLRTPHQQQAFFWATVEAVTGDPEIGLHLCPHLPPFHGDVIEYLMFSSPTFGEGWTRAIKYLRLISDALDIALIQDEQGMRARVTATTLEAPQLRHTEICVIYEMIQFAKTVSDNRGNPQRLSLRISQRAPLEEYEKVFGCPVVFEQLHSEIWFAPEILSYRSARCDPDLLYLHEELAQKRLNKLMRLDLVERIRAVFARRLELHDCELEDVAKELDMPPRRLRFELTQAGTSFSDQLSDFRYALAKKLLRTTQEPIENIVYLTGFSEPSTFYRAFKRWSGMTPVQYREQRTSKSEK